MNYTATFISYKRWDLLGSVLVCGMRSVPGAVATGYGRNLARNRSFVAASLLRAGVNPVATAPGTDSMTCLASGEQHRFAGGDGAVVRYVDESWRYRLVAANVFRR